MKKRIFLCIISLMLLFTVLFTVSACKCSFSYKVSVTYDKTQGVIEGEGKYKKGKPVILKASALEGFEFDGWYNGQSFISNNTTYEFVMPKTNISLFAKFKAVEKYTLSISCNDSQGTVTGGGSYKKGEIVALKATPNSGYFFDGWYKEGSLLSKNNSYNYIMPSSNVTLLAKFTQDTSEKVLTINYLYKDGSVASQKFVKGFIYGSNYSINSPILQGYTCDKSVVSGVLLNNTTINVIYTPIKYKLTINYVDEHNNPMIGVDTYTSQVDYKAVYNVESPVVAGYTADKTIISGSMQIDGVVETVVYTPNTYSVTITYVGADKWTPIRYQENYKYGDVLDINSPNVVGYTPSEGEIVGKVVGNIEKTITYSPKQYKIIVNYLKTNSESLGFTTYDVVYNQTYSITAENRESETPALYLDKYELSGTFNVDDIYLGNLISNASSNEIIYNFVYTNKERTIPIKYVNTNGNQLASSSSITKNIGDTYSVSAVTVEGYTPRDSVLEGIITANLSQEIVFVYEINLYDLTINYVFENDNKAYDSHTEKVAYNSDYSVMSPEITGYTPSISVVEGIIGLENVTVKVIYYPITTSLTINYKYSDGTEAAPLYRVEYDFGEVYSVESPIVEGHSPSINKVEGVMDEDGVIVDVVYTVNSYTLTINYVSSVSGFSDVKPTSYTKTLQYNEPYSVTSPSIAGLKADCTTVSGVMGAGDIVKEVKYDNSEVYCYLFLVNKDPETSSNIGSVPPMVLTFENSYKEYNIDYPYIYNKLGFKTKYHNLIFRINKNETMGKSIGCLQLVTIVNGEEIILDSGASSTGLNQYKIYWNLSFEPIRSTVTVCHRLDSVSLFEDATETIGGIYGQTIEIPYKDFGRGYIPAGTSESYTFDENNKTIYLEYTSDEFKVTINYVDIHGYKVKEPYFKYHKYNTKFNITSPTIADYVLVDESQSVISGEIDLEDIVIDVIYKLDWDTDSLETLIIDTPLKLLEFSRNADLWNRNVDIKANIDMSSYSMAPIGNYSTPYYGNINGNNYTISNVILDTSNISISSRAENSQTNKYAYVGFFGYAFGKIGNLTLNNISINYNMDTSDNTVLYAGLLVGQFSGYSISNVNVSGNINVSASTAYVGGVVGLNNGRQLSNVTSNVEINGSIKSNDVNIGGIVGTNYVGTISSCTSTLKIDEFSTVNTLNISGICGKNTDGVVTTSCTASLQVNDSNVTCDNNPVNKNNILG